MKAKSLLSMRSMVAAVAMLLLPSLSAQAYTYTAIDGTGGTGGEGYAKLVDGSINTKMGHSFTSGVTVGYVIFKSDEPIVPGDYFLITGNDTGSNPGRNWESWNIYAANFASDLDATRDSKDWVKVDEQSGVILPALNFGPVDMHCSIGSSEAYSYFMVEITDVVQKTDVYMQMAEFGWGTSDEFFGTADITYTLIDGTHAGTGGEDQPKLFDGNYDSKWGSTFNSSTPDWMIFKASRSIAPTYYCLVTGGDNAAYPGRNWKSWAIYGMNAASDADVAEGSAEWVLLDERVDVSGDIMVDKNKFEIYFEFNKGVTDKFKYFKIVVNARQGGDGGFMQMSEFFMGDAGTLKNACEKNAENVMVDGSQPCDKAAYEALVKMAENIKNAKDVFEMKDLYQAALEQQLVVKNSINAYADYVQLVAQVRNHYDNHTCITGEGRTIIGNYINNNEGPSATYPNGTYAYIIENGTLTTSAINEESIFVNMMLEKYASDLTEGAIDVTYEVIGGDAGFSDTESCFSLFDGDDMTKWCSPENEHRIVIFKTSEPIAPTYYRLFTSGDTGKYSERNWKTWTVFGANFDKEDEWDVMMDWDGWVALDIKENIGTDVIPAASNTACFLYMSNPSDTKYEYFMIDITQPTGTMQMSEFTFGNSANFILTRQEYYEHFSDQDYDNQACSQSLLADYNQALKRLQTTATMTELGKLYTTLSNLQAEIEASIVNYDEYRMAVDELETYLAYMSGSASDMWYSYINETVEPGDLFTYGSYPYIMENMGLNNDEILAEIAKIQAVIKAVLEGGFIVLDGNTKWGDNENHAKLLDKDFETKWGGAMPTGGSYVIFSVMEASQPLFYKLTTGNDTESYTGRNWGSWEIFAANFNSDAEATRDAEGWVLIDKRDSIGQDRLPAKNFFTVPFGFSEGVDEEYKYFKIEISKAQSGGDIQMTEFEFGTEDEFEDIKDEYEDSLSTFDVDVVAEEELLLQFKDFEGAIYDAENMEDLYQAFLGIIDVVNKIQKSASAYDLFSSKVNENIAFVKDSKLDASDALTTLNAYLEGKSAAGEQFPNGSAATIMEEHVLSADSLYAEIDYMTELVAAAVAAGYGAGTNITSLVVNPSFAKGTEGWEGELYAYDTNEEHTMSAAEFKDDSSEFDIHQTLTGLKNGLYEVHISGATRPADDIYSTNYTAMLYANDNKVYLKADIDDMIDVDAAEDRVNCWINGPIADKPIYENQDEEAGVILGYVLWGVQSCCYAFQAGRYDNVIIAEVTDGTLTFGVKNDGAQAGKSWTGLGNTRIYYLGDVNSAEAEAGLDRAFEAQSIIANSLNDYYGFLDVADYKTMPYVNEADLKAIKENLKATDNAGKYAAIVKNSALYQSIYDAKNAYCEAIAATLMVQDKWDAHTAVMAGDVQTAYNNDVNAVLNGSMGLYSADEAIAAKDELVKKYPCYIDLDANKAKGSLEITETAPFEYELKANGTRPNIGLNKCMYEPLGEKYIVCFEYKSDAKLEGGALFFAHPNLSASETVAYGDLEAASEWTRIFIDITPAVRDWNWGTATDHWMRWDLASAGTFNVNVRNMIFVTKAEMEAMGGQTINDGISDVIFNNEEAPAIYTIQGVRVAEPTEKGIYIVNGQKVLVR